MTEKKHLITEPSDLLALLKDNENQDALMQMIPGRGLSIEFSDPKEGAEPGRPLHPATVREMIRVMAVIRDGRPVLLLGGEKPSWKAGKAKKA
jgi:hypothetical protein